MPKAWPAALAGSPAAAVIERAIGRGNLAHSLLLHGDDLGLLTEVADAIADRLLNPDGAYAGASHPDHFALRPAGKSRTITADATRDLIAQVQMTAAVGARKVAVVYEADRMNPFAANIFLKTLEEPPAATTLLLVTTHPYVLLPTIRSRCLHFRFPTREGDGHPPAEGWKDWLADYEGWLERASAGRPEGLDRTAVADHIFTIYGLLARFGQILDAATAAAWEKVKPTLPPDLEEAEQVAIETGLSVGLRARLFADVELATRAHARRRLESGDLSTRQRFAAAIADLERSAGLLKVNLNESAALESFLLVSLRLWSQPAS